jgi:HEAT repeat protein
MNRALSPFVVLALLLGSSTAGAAATPSFQELLANLKSPNAKTRREAAEALGESHRREAVMPLAALVRDPEAEVRLEVVTALRRLRDLDAVPALVTSLGDGEPKIRREAVAGLVEMYTDPERASGVSRFLGLFSDEEESPSISPAVNVDPAVLEGLGVALRDEEKDIRRDAVVALTILDGRSEIEEILVALQDLEPSVREAAVRAVARLGTAEDGQALIPLLADQSSGVRTRVLRALGELRVSEAGPSLRRLFEASRSKETSLRILESLSRVRDPNQADLFRLLVQDPDPERRRLAVEGLGRIADPGLLTALKKDFQRERNDELRLAYAFALTLLGDTAFVDSIVLSLPSRTLGVRCHEYLMELGPDLLTDLYPYLSDPDANIRAALCDLLGEMGDPDAISQLTPLVNDPSSKVADSANRAVSLLRLLEEAAFRQ